jgi:hypothetical protein
VFFLSAKNTIGRAEWNKNDSTEFGTFIGDLDNMLFILEMLGLTKGVLDKSFERLKILKVLSIAMNIKISNAIDYNLLPSSLSNYRLEQSLEADEDNKDSLLSSKKANELAQEKLKERIDLGMTEIDMFKFYFQFPEATGYEMWMYYRVNPYNSDEVT